MEPLLLAEESSRFPLLADLAYELGLKSAGLARSVQPPIAEALAGLVRSMNCYYSNLIEGHDTHPVDIERALAGDYSSEPKKRVLQLEAKAHIRVQEWIDAGGLGEDATSPMAIREIHRRFCSELPDELLWVEEPGPSARVRVTPGELRDRHVQVGRHVPISPGALPRFLDRFAAAYSRSSLDRFRTVLNAAAAHHRLLWIHPFPDGNGRVARLVTQLTLARATESRALWSAARGLARNRSEYARLLAECDLPRRNDLDGRGHLSEESLADFTAWFLKTCLDQAAFMESLLLPTTLASRIGLWVAEAARLEGLPLKAGAILEAALLRGELQRGDVAGIIGMTDRHARRITSDLLARGVLSSGGPREPLRLAFPAAVVTRWLPNLYPEPAG